MQKKLLLVAMLALPGTGCDSKECTLIGCGSQFRIDFQRAEWTPGNYKVEIVADGDALECVATLPLDCDAPPACPGAPQVLLLLDGCALDPAEHRIAGLEFQEGSSPDTAPKAVQVRVLQDDALLGEGSYMPVYTESFPNGPDCAPGCFQADPVTLALE